MGVSPKVSNLAGVECPINSKLYYSFEPVHQDLLIVYEMLREILTSPREWLLNLPQGTVRSVGMYLQEFGEKRQAIVDFNASGENPSETHANLLQEIFNFCSSAKGSLNQTVAYLKSKQIEHIESQIKTAVEDTIENFNTEVDRAKKTTMKPRNERKKDKKNSISLNLNWKTNLEKS